MNFTEAEIEKAKELKRLGFPKQKGKDGPLWTPQRGHYLHTRHCPPGCVEVSPTVFLITEPNAEHADTTWLPTFEDCLEIARQTQITFSLITDYLHRKRFADTEPRLGLYHLFIEKWR